MKKTSLWLHDIKSKTCDSLKNDIDVDVLIIGGGITGISTAYHLKDSSLKVALVDQNKVGTGVSSKTTGKLTFLQDLIYSKIDKGFSRDLVKVYLDSQINAINMVENIVKKNNISCDFEKVDSFVFTNEEKEIKKIKEEKRLLESLGVKVREHSSLQLNIPMKYAISVSNTAVFHPIKYILALKKICLESKVSIYENTKILDIKKKKDKYYCKTKTATIISSKVVLACHYPFFLFPFFFPLKGHLERSYLSASLVNKTQKLSAINTSVLSKSFRYHFDKDKSYFIYLNGSHNITKRANDNLNFHNLIYDIEKLKLFPQYIWSNHDIITNDYLPYIGCLRSGDNSLLIGTGYNTWGMTNGSLAGKILSDMVLEQENKYIPLFDPHRRKNIDSILNIPTNIYYSIKPFLEHKIFKRKKWYSTNIFFEKRNGQNVAIYQDTVGNKHIVYNKCPHLKCSLIFNETEKTWDCPCHGSRFSINGECIQGPSNYDIKYKE